MELVMVFLLVAIVLLVAGFLAGMKYGQRAESAAKAKLEIARDHLHGASLRLSTYVSGEAVKIKEEIDAGLKKIL